MDGGRIYVEGKLLSFMKDNDSEFVCYIKALPNVISFTNKIH